MEVLIDNKKAESTLMSIIRSQPVVNQNKIIFVGEEPGERTITTLPSTFEDGEYRYTVYTTTLEQKSKGKSVSDINREYTNRIYIYNADTLIGQSRDDTPIHFQMREFAGYCLINTITQR